MANNLHILVGGSTYIFRQSGFTQDAVHIVKEYLDSGIGYLDKLVKESPYTVSKLPSSKNFPDTRVIIDEVNESICFEVMDEAEDSPQLECYKRLGTVPMLNIDVHKIPFNDFTQFYNCVRNKTYVSALRDGERLILQRIW